MKYNRKTIIIIFFIIELGMILPFAFQMTKEFFKKDKDEFLTLLKQYENILVKNGIIRHSKNLTTRIKFLISGKVISNSVFDGKDKWLFYSSKNDGHLINDYKGKNHPSNQKLEEMKNNLISNFTFLKNRGIKFIVFVAPNKGKIYSRYFPDNFIIAPQTTTDYVVEQMQSSNFDFPVIYPYKELLEYSLKYQLYYPRDTHWNQLGAYIGFRALLKEGFNYDLPTIDSLSIKEEQSKGKGDLTYMVKLDKYYPYLTEYSLKEYDDIQTTTIKDYVNPNPLINKSVLVIGDSFSEGLTKYLIKTFTKVSVIHRKDYNIDKLEKFKPDVVVFESVGRLFYQKDHTHFSLEKK